MLTPEVCALFNACNTVVIMSYLHTKEQSRGTVKKIFVFVELNYHASVRTGKWAWGKQTHPPVCLECVWRCCRQVSFHGMMSEVVWPSRRGCCKETSESPFGMGLNLNGFLLCYVSRNLFLLPYLLQPPSFSVPIPHRA